MTADVVSDVTLGELSRRFDRFTVAIGLQFTELKEAIRTGTVSREVFTISRGELVQRVENLERDHDRQNARFRSTVTAAVLALLTSGAGVILALVVH